MWPGWLPCLELSEPDVTEKHTKAGQTQKPAFIIEGNKTLVTWKCKGGKLLNCSYCSQKPGGHLLGA